MTQEELDALMAGDFEDEGEVKEDVSADIPVDTPSIEDEMIDEEMIDAEQDKAAQQLMHEYRPSSTMSWPPPPPTAQASCACWFPAAMWMWTQQPWRAIPLQPEHRYWCTQTAQI